MKRYRLLIYALLLFAAVFVGSCSSSRENEAGPDAGASQCHLVLKAHGTSGFTTESGYTVKISEGHIILKDIILNPSGEEHEDEHDHDHSLNRHEEAVSDEGFLWEGFHSLEMEKGSLDLGFINGNPGTYTSFDFYIHPVHEHDEHASVKHDDDESGSIYFRGTAEKDGAVYSFTGLLPVEKEIEIGGFSAEMAYGRYTDMELVFHIDHWFEAIDFAGAEKQADGAIIFSPDSNPQMAEIISDAAATHIKPQVK